MSADKDDWVILPPVLSKRRSPSIAFKSDGTLRINVPLYEAMGKPTHVNILVSTKTHLLGVRPTTADDENAFAVSVVRNYKLPYRDGISHYRAGTKTMWEATTLEIPADKGARPAYQDGDVWCIDLNVSSQEVQP